MRALALVLGLLALTAPAIAQTDLTGVDGYVLSADTHRPLENAEVAIYRMPMNNAAHAVRTLYTNKKGFFSKIMLEPGRYVITANADGLQAACVTSDLTSGVISRISVEMSKDHEVCVGKNVRSALVVPGQTADVYVIH